MSDRTRQRHAGVAEGLDADEIRSAMQLWREVGRANFLERFDVKPAVRYVVVDGPDEFDALALLVGARHLSGKDIAPAYRGDRINVADPLRSLGFFVEAVGGGGGAPVNVTAFDFASWLERFDGETDGFALVQRRREQAVLRTSLGLTDNRPGQCGLCGLHLPSDLLVAAHIKPRGTCSAVERVDAPWVVMSACLVGCDALFELGYLGVGELGVLIAAASCPIPVALDGPAPAWCPEREPYFAWHRRYRLRG